jgi:hypothetical protein
LINIKQYLTDIYLEEINKERKGSMHACMHGMRMHVHRLHEIWSLALLAGCIVQSWALGSMGLSHVKTSCQKRQALIRVQTGNAYEARSVPADFLHGCSLAEQSKFDTIKNLYRARLVFDPVPATYAANSAGTRL